jgi:tetratricopeptide (TPR) repeat protein
VRGAGGPPPAAARTGGALGVSGEDRRHDTLRPGSKLNAILHKACAPDARERYCDAKEMHGDLELLRAGRSVKQRHAKKAAVAVALGSVLITGLVSLRQSRPQPLDPLTTGKNVGGYPPTAMRGTTNKAAWEQYRLGYFAWRRATGESWQQAGEHFNQAIELDPKFALAYCGLWSTKFTDTWLLTRAETDEFRRLANKMVALDNRLAETHWVLGFIRFWEWKWPEAEAEYREALRLNPDCIPAWICPGFQLSHVGRTDESLRVLDRGLQVDPNEPQLVKMKGYAYFVRREFQRALALYLESARRKPLFPEAHRWAARAYLALTNYPAAIDEREKHDLLNGKPYPYQAKQDYGDLRRAFQEGGPSGYWRAQLAHMKTHLNPTNEPYAFAQIYAWLNDKEQALDCLEKAYARHDELVYLIFDECWDPWRDEPRFEAVRQKVGLPRHPNFPARCARFWTAPVLWRFRWPWRVRKR